HPAAGRAQGRKHADGDVMRRLFAPVFGLLVCFAPAAALALEPGRVYGNADGCRIAATGVFDSDMFLMVTTDGLDGMEWLCEFGATTPAADGGATIAAECSGEGDTWAETFTLAAPAPDGSMDFTNTHGPLDDLRLCEGVTPEQLEKALRG